MLSAYRSHAVESPASVQAYAARSLDILRAIESTLDFLDHNIRQIPLITEGLESVLTDLRTAASVSAIDPEERVCQLLKDSGELTQKIHRTLALKRNAASDDDRVHSEDGLVDAFDRCIDLIDDAHTAIEDLREWISTHDALLDQSKDQRYVSVDALFVGLGIDAD